VQGNSLLCPLSAGKEEDIKEALLAVKKAIKILKLLLLYGIMLQHTKHSINGDGRIRFISSHYQHTVQTSIP
jgi:hypothetical protein